MKDLILAKDTVQTPTAVQSLAKGDVGGPNETPKKKMGLAPAAPARLRRRHWSVLLSFIVLVLIPLMVVTWYLYDIAEDQFTSRVGFSVRSEEPSVPTDLLGGLGALSSGSSKDTDVLYAYIQSQQLVQRIDEKINLKEIYSKPDVDFVFAFDASGSIEDLLRYWQHMVKVHYDAGTGLIELQVHAFTAEDAQLVAQEIFDASSELINTLSAISRADATRYAEEELAEALELLKSARQAVTRFRSTTQIVDPTANVQGQMGLVTTLQTQLAEALIEQDLLLEVINTTDPRVEQLARRVQVIQNRIAEERKKFGLGEESGDGVFSNLVGEYEALVVDREFAEQSYLSARASYDAAVAESRRKSRYLAAYVDPTLAETAEYPKRLLLISVITIFLIIGWATLTLLAYSIKDRR